MFFVVGGLVRYEGLAAGLEARIPSGSPQPLEPSLSVRAPPRRDLMWTSAVPSVFLNAGLQPGQAFAKAQFDRGRRAIVTYARNSVGDFSFGLQGWSLGALVPGGRRAIFKPAGVEDDGFGAFQLRLDADRRSCGIRVGEPARQRCGEHPIGRLKQKE
ncbi:hypothetical protein [Bradyrhizobium sp. WSM471]|uniref:hypothetical protein n=1 Tax=Bradyrhizobium sp. WSM471 TaxID=319017 RepID=UPI0005637ADA|nr:MULTISPECIES: hypothetical protein [Bradyrhizobium]UFW42128.1 hypothetical protein BcanWSM471_02625 [Bradyrhizobium canariense]